MLHADYIIRYFEMALISIENTIDVSDARGDVSAFRERSRHLSRAYFAAASRRHFPSHLLRDDISLIWLCRLPHAASRLYFVDSCF